MNWIDEGALYSQINLFLREDLGRGDITTQSIIARNTRARARFVAGENMIVAGLEGVTPYNSYINHTPPYKWVIHPNWYTTAGYRAKNNGMLGRSNGCITVDPAENNKIITRLQGALIYVTVGDDPIEQYL